MGNQADTRLMPTGLGPQATIGIDFLSKTMYLEDRTVRLQLWCVCNTCSDGNLVDMDPAGTPRGRSAFAA